MMICPHCNSNLEGGLIFDTFFKQYGDKEKALETAAMYGATETEGRWGRQIGIEVRGKYDGVSYWKCPDCETVWDRFTGEIVNGDDL